MGCCPFRDSRPLHPLAVRRPGADTRRITRGSRPRHPRPNRVRRGNQRAPACKTAQVPATWPPGRTSGRRALHREARSGTHAGRRNASGRAAAPRSSAPGRPRHGTTTGSRGRRRVARESRRVTGLRPAISLRSTGSGHRAARKAWRSDGGRLRASPSTSFTLSHVARSMSAALHSPAKPESNLMGDRRRMRGGSRPRAQAVVEPPLAGRSAFSARTPS